MNDHDKAIIEACARMMGFTILDKPIELSEHAGTYFFWDLHAGRFGDRVEPIKGVTYQHRQVLIEGGLPAFGVKWYTWNPLTDDAATLDLMRGVVAAGHEISLTLKSDGAYCDLYNEAGGIDVQNADAGLSVGRSVCETVKFILDKPL